MSDDSLKVSRTHPEAHKRIELKDANGNVAITAESKIEGSWKCDEWSEEKERELVVGAENLVEFVSASQALIEKMREIHAHPSWKSMWVYLHVHNNDYNGPRYEDEFKRAEKALEAMRLKKQS